MKELTLDFLSFVWKITISSYLYNCEHCGQWTNSETFTAELQMTQLSDVHLVFVLATIIKITTVSGQLCRQSLYVDDTFLQSVEQALIPSSIWRRCQCLGNLQHFVVQVATTYVTNNIQLYCFTVINVLREANLTWPETST